MDPEIIAGILNDYNKALDVLTWLADNGKIVNEDGKKPGQRDRMKMLARDFAVGPGPASSNYKAGFFDLIVSK